MHIIDGIKKKQNKEILLIYGYHFVDIEMRFQFGQFQGDLIFSLGYIMIKSHKGYCILNDFLEVKLTIILIFLIYL